ncbi:hypothetical protein NE237_019472 [Protea cynaroides]|uniref:Dof zinc finger protein n=1 Tax=Protea cynaroides TaxID=273540 RepID=A0A9Q0GL31_9MAGN|nr:hypothetical protein NE237_019472 [Protea cynaroides]
MQDFRAMGSGGGTVGGRIFAGDRRIRPHPNLALKCPRYDSLNTKFCYYNNYNLSQPRHFCKSCRRYWTKGGVLRNRLKSKSPKERKSTTSHSGGESSSLYGHDERSRRLVNFPDSTLFVPRNPNPNTNLEPPMLDNIEQASDGGIFPETGMTSSMVEEPEDAELTNWVYGSDGADRFDRHAGHERNVGGGGGLTGLEWGTGGDQGPYDLGSS